MLRFLRGMAEFAICVAVVLFLIGSVGVLAAVSARLPFWGMVGVGGTNGVMVFLIMLAGWRGINALRRS